MAIGERIRYLRNLRGMTQKYLGMLIGFDENAADVRIAQYESSKRTPKEKMVADLANALDVSTHALTLPDIDSYVGLAHTLFALEDLYGLRIDTVDDELCLTLDKSRGMTYVSMYDFFRAWSKEMKKLKNGEITQEEYNVWRYNYPRTEAERTRESLDALRAKKKAESEES